MSMSKRDFEAIAIRVKMQHEFAYERMQVVAKNSPQFAGDAGEVYEAEAATLAALAVQLGDHFGVVNPRFNADTFYEACGLRKFYSSPTKRTRGPQRIFHEFNWLFISDATFRFEAQS